MSTGELAVLNDDEGLILEPRGCQFCCRPLSSVFVALEAPDRRHFSLMALKRIQRKLQEISRGYDERDQTLESG